MSYTILQERNLGEVGKKRVTDGFRPRPILLPTRAKKSLYWASISAAEALGRAEAVPLLGAEGCAVGVGHCSMAWPLPRGPGCPWHTCIAHMTHRSATAASPLGPTRTLLRPPCLSGSPCPRPPPPPPPDSRLPHQWRPQQRLPEPYRWPHPAPCSAYSPRQAGGRPDPGHIAGRARRRPEIGQRACRRRAAP
jgi:hypothetical protein